jgi:hypothetical protein
MTHTKPPEAISKTDIVGAITAATEDVFSTMLGLEGVTSQEIPLPQTVAAAPASFRSSGSPGRGLEPEVCHVTPRVRACCHPNY